MITLRLDKVTFSYPSTPIFSDASCEIQQGCYGLIGPNGSGKTTLLKLILGELKPDAGVVLIDKRMNVAYMAQEVALDPEQPASEAVRQGAGRVLALEIQLAELEAKFAHPEYYADEKRLARLIEQHERALSAYHELGGSGLEGQVKALLTSIGFKDHELNLPVKNLSGGQRKLLGLVRIILSRPDILLLDEPDNHLDIPSCELLEDALLDFNGTLLAISDDWYFLDRIANRIIELHGDGLSEYSGNYSDYEIQRLSPDAPN